MGYPVPKATKSKKKTSLRPGIYDGVITDVVEAEGFFPGEAFVLVYKLNVDNGTYLYRETFMSNREDERTEALISAMEEYGFSMPDLDVLIGQKVRLDLRKQQVGTRVYLNVYKREFIGDGEGA